MPHILPVLVRYLSFALLDDSGTGWIPSASEDQVAGPVGGPPSWQDAHRRGSDYGASGMGGDSNRRRAVSSLGWLGPRCGFGISIHSRTVGLAHDDSLAVVISAHRRVRAVHSPAADEARL